MAKKAKASVINALKKQGAGKLWDKHKSDEVKLSGGGDLPEGINGGVAQLVQASLGVQEKGDNKGKPYLMLSGVVRIPEEYKGMRATKFVPLYESANKSFEDRLEEGMNELRKMDVDTAELQLEDLEDVLEGLEEEKPHFRFRTWKGRATKQFPDPRVNLDFRGTCEFNGEEDDDVVDETEEPEPPDDEEDDTEEEEDVDVKALAKAADKGDEDAATQLAELAEEQGLDPDDYETWKELGAAVEEAQEGGDEEEDAEEDTEEEEAEEEESEEEEDLTPEEGDVYLYKTKGARKAKEMEVVKVLKSRKTVTLKDLDSDKEYKGVPWSDLSS